MLCSCVSRDVFGIKDEDVGWEVNKSDKYDICRYVNFVSPLYSSYPGCDVNQADFENALNEYRELYPDQFSNFRWRCKYIDITHSCMAYLKENKPDYFVIDSYAAVYDYCMLEDETIITNMDGNIIDYLVNKKIIPPIYKRFAFQDILPSELEEYVALFARNVKSIFKPEQIILIEIKAADLYLQDGGVYPFPESFKTFNQNMGRYFSVLCKYFSDCNIIRTNTILLGNSAHKWGRFPVHYVNEVYFDYYLKKIDLVVSKDPDIELKAAELDASFTRMIGGKYFSCFYYALRNRVMPGIKRISESKYSRVRTAHGTYMFYDAEYDKLFHEKNAGYLRFPICAIHDSNQVMLYFVMDNKVFYIKKIMENIEVEICAEPVPLDVYYNVNGSLSIGCELHFLSARNDGEFSWMEWNREWEQLSLENF